jgi:hypothetical protein
MPIGGRAVYVCGVGKSSTKKLHPCASSRRSVVGQARNKDVLTLQIAQFDPMVVIWTREGSWFTCLGIYQS